MLGTAVSCKQEQVKNMVSFLIIWITSFGGEIIVLAHSATLKRVVLLVVKMRVSCD